MSMLGFVFGVWVLLLMVFLFEFGVVVLVLLVLVQVVCVFGVVGLLVYVVIVLLVGCDGCMFCICGYVLWLFDCCIMFGVIVLSMVELVLVVVVFYVLLLMELFIGLFGFVGLYLVVVLVGLIFSVLVGLGVFEWSLFKLLLQVVFVFVFVVVLIYWVIYYVVFLLLVILFVFVLVLWWLLCVSVGVICVGWIVLCLWLLQIIVLVVFSVGVVLVIDGMLFILCWYLFIVLLLILEILYLFGSLVGVVLLLIGQGLQWCSYVVWMLVLVICVIVLLLIWLCGGQVLIVFFVLLVVMVLWVLCCEFYCQGVLLDEVWLWLWICNFGLVLVVVIWLLFFVYSYVEYQNELWWQFVLFGNVLCVLCVLLVVVIVLIIFGLVWLLYSMCILLLLVDVLMLDVFVLILQCVEDIQVCLVFIVDKVVLCDLVQIGFVMMQCYGGLLIVMGDLVGLLEIVCELIWCFCEEVDWFGLCLVFYQVGEVYWQIYFDLGLILVKFGEEVMVLLQGFILEGCDWVDLCQVWNCGKCGGLSFCVVLVEEVLVLLLVLLVIFQVWLDDKVGDEKGFLLGSFDLDYLVCFLVVLVEVEGCIVVFVNLWQVLVGYELLVDLMCYVNDVLKGMMDFLFIELFLWGCDYDFQCFLLGMVLLFGLVQYCLVGCWNWFVNVVVWYGECFYGFSGLCCFKFKFVLVWCLCYLVVLGGMYLFVVLFDVICLIFLDLC